MPSLRVFPLVFTTADHAAPPEMPITAHLEKQSVLMQKVVHESTTFADSRYFPLYLHGENAPNPDPCTWSGIECTDNLVTTFVMRGVIVREVIDPEEAPSRSRTVQWCADLDWMPPTVQSMHVVNTRMLKGWLAERLPRDLRYMCLIHCNVHKTDALGRPIALHKLPRRMEELFLTNG